MSIGRFITFEGGEGAGKSTQARLLADALTARGVDVVRTREPGGTPGAEAIRALLLDPAASWTMRAEALLFAAARADHVARLIRPALDAGRWVVCDRFLDSSLAYQAGEADLRDADIAALHTIGSDGLLPDLTVVVTLDPEASARRLAERDGDRADRIGGRPAAYHRRVASRFEALAAASPSRLAVIPGHGSPAQVHARVMEAVGARLGIGA